MFRFAQNLDYFKGRAYCEKLSALIEADMTTRGGGFAPCNLSLRQIARSKSESRPRSCASSITVFHRIDCLHNELQDLFEPC